MTTNSNKRGAKGDILIEMKNVEIDGFSDERWHKIVKGVTMIPGSGEFVLWPYITYKAGFIFFWACILGVFTQYFLNMEIERWTLATGESAITGFCRLSKHWAWVMLLLNIVPWVWPGWATGAGTILSWLIFGPVEEFRPDGFLQQAKDLYPGGFRGAV